MTPKKLTLVHYEFVEGIAEKRAPYREAHLNHAKTVRRFKWMMVCELR